MFVLDTAEYLSGPKILVLIKTVFGNKGIHVYTCISFEAKLWIDKYYFESVQQRQTKTGLYTSVFSMILTEAEKNSYHKLFSGEIMHNWWNNGIYLLKHRRLLIFNILIALLNMNNEYRINNDHSSMLILSNNLMYTEQSKTFGVFLCKINLDFYRIKLMLKFTISTFWVTYHISNTF